MNTCKWSCISFLALGICLAGRVDSASADEPPAKKLVAATRHVPPFAIKKPDGSWSGFSIDLWRRIAEDLDLRYELREMKLDEMLEALESGEADVAVAAITLTHRREERVDFSHPYYSSGLGIAVIPGHERNSWLRALGRIVVAAGRILGGIIAFLLIIGVVVYFLERRKNSEHFGGGPLKGIASGIWWAAVTITTVGYGDKAPRTPVGRVLAVIWMFGGILIISAFTAAMTSALTISQLESGIEGPQDLRSLRVATVRGTTSEEYMRGERIDCKTYTTAEAAIDALAAGNADAVVYDAPVLRYLAYRHSSRSVQVRPRRFNRQQYAIAFASDSKLREPINRVLIRKTADSDWQDTLDFYMGRQ